jgi:MYXO-CTERM domain-containing protein
MSSLRWVKLAAMASALTIVGSACSSRDVTPSESTGATAEAVTTCSERTIGMPCAPAGSTSECDGVCTPQSQTFGGVYVTCQKVDPKTNVGKICGSTAGTSCASVCGDLGGGAVGCISGPGVAAPDGAACRPGTSTTATVCDGECKAGACVARAARACTFGLANSNCGYNFCDTKNASTCTLYAAAAKGRTCSDNSTCTTAEQCDGAGKCVGTAISCAVPTNPCLDPGSCNATTGKCDYPANTKPCTLTGDLCHAGVCAGGTCTTAAAIDCDDKNVCTVDSCDPTVGCKHAPKCVAPDACQTAACDATSGACSFTAVNCDDKNPCTTDSCDTTTGCKHDPIPGCTYNPDAGVDTGVPPTDTGVIDTGVVDTGVKPDTGVIDTGVNPTDTGVIDTGVNPTDTGVTPDDTGVTPDDTGVTPTDSSTPGDAIGDGDVPDTGTAELPPLESSGCGCETPRSSSTTSLAGVAALALAGLVVGRRRVRR